MPCPLDYAAVAAAVVLPEDDEGEAITKTQVILPQLQAIVMNYMQSAEFKAEVKAVVCT